jgi:hypothetical protein
MYQFFLFLFLILSISSFGQRYKTEAIIRKSDRLIIAAIGQDIFDEHFKLDTTSDFFYASVDGENAKPISLNKKVNKHFKYLSVSYLFYLRESEEPVTKTSIVFDRKLNSLYPIDTSFIPPFILQHQEDNFLSKEQVLQIANSKFQEKAIKPIETSLKYDFSRKIYVWTVINTLDESRSYNDEVSRYIEFLEVDANNGKILNFYKALQAPLH